MTENGKIVRWLFRLRQKLNSIFDDDSILISAGVYPNDEYFKEKKKELKRTYRNKEARNIAIWGYAGVGKSSFIQHFEAKTLHIPLCRFLRISLSHNSGGTKEYSKDEIEKHLAKQINRQYQRNPFFTAIDIFLLIISIAFLKNYDWLRSNLGSAPSFEKLLFLFFLTTGSVTFLILTTMVINSFSVSKGLMKIGKGSDDTGIELDLTLNSPEIRKSIIKMKWKIRSTVVFEDLELFESEIFLLIIQDLLQLNAEINSEIQKKLIGKIFKNPIRFIYVCRDGDIRRRIGDKEFQDNIFIEERLTCNNLHFYVEDIVNNQISKGLCKQMTEGEDKVSFDFMYFNTVAKLIGPEDLNYRKINQVLKRYIGLWKNFSENLGTIKISHDDYTRLISFAIYGEYFPEDCKKFKTGNCLALQKVSKKNLKHKVDKPELFIYLTQECSENYRINRSCIKYLGVNAREVERLKKEIELDVNAGEYENALALIDLIDLYVPEKSEYYKLQEEVKKKISESVMLK